MPRVITAEQAMSHPTVVATISWVSLTKEEIDSALSKYQNWYEFAAHLENILKEKNQ